MTPTKPLHPEDVNAILGIPVDVPGLIAYEFSEAFRRMAEPLHPNCRCVDEPPPP